MMPSFPVGFLLLLDVIALSLLAVALPPFSQPRAKTAVVAVAAIVPLAALVTFVIAKGFHAVGVGRVAGATAWLSMTLVFLAGLLAAGLVLAALVPSAFPKEPLRPLGLVALAGLLVGFGTRLGNGCTSGHGVCGISRLSARSTVATLSFMAAGAVTVFVTRHLLGASQ